MTQYRYDQPESKPVAINKRARDALFAYIKGGNALRGPGSRLKLAYLVDPYNRQISEVFLRAPYSMHISALLLHREAMFEQHHVPFGPHATYVCVVENPRAHNFPDTLRGAFRYRQAIKRPPYENVWHFIGRGVITAHTHNHHTAHCTTPHSWLLDTFEFFDDSTHEFKPARTFTSRVLTTTDL